MQHINQPQKTLDLFDKHNVNPEEIDAIIVATVTPDMFFPATACLVQNKIGAKNAWGFDLSAACSGFLFALDDLKDLGMPAAVQPYCTVAPLRGPRPGRVRR